jgi:hypothetical protein
MMVAKINRGPISKCVKKLCGNLYFVNGDEAEKESEFKKGLKIIIQDHGVYLNIAKSLESYANKNPEEHARLWRLVDEVDPGIKKAWEYYRKHPWGISD